MVILGASFGGAASPTTALPYDGTNPGTTACGDGSHTVYVLDSENILSATGAVIGKVELRQSVHCATVWSRVYNLTGNAVDARERLYMYDDGPNDGTPTINTESDRLSAKGGATDSGWSKQFRDRPAFLAKGEIFHGGAWRTALTKRSLMWSQADGNWPDKPYTCDDTADDYCHRWRTTATGGPITVKYYLDQSLTNLENDPRSDINTVLQSYEDLSGPSPSWTHITDGTHAVIFFEYNDPNDVAYARATGIAQSAAPRYYNSGYVKINNARTGSSSNWNPLICHEVGHVLGLKHITTGGFVGSKATCHGAEFQGPYIDDQFLLTKIYSTPLAAN
jgi:hypothetical protein